MKQLDNILGNTSPVKVIGSTNINIAGLCIDSREATVNSLFFALTGTQVDGHNYIDSAIAQGAIAVICERLPNTLNPEVTYIVVSNSNQSLGVVASEFYDNPSHRLKLIGITGTNGKTTTATLLYRLASALGEKSGLISTVQNQIGDKTIASTHTTPNAIELNKLLSEMVNEQCTHCFIEVSS
ncbi:MAG TPA: UDP-N-acetylmuramoyl-L-alanyl-D-glutamate--2,6-diaminopimelate ligase, partial [Bacteroidales bacterium]|nr:UDP-N-acetylmuramoyl-L-alanyl-D-glutamate--2,6-diaminopimelate ligase [Bacteroidales bacterium]